MNTYLNKQHTVHVLHGHSRPVLFEMHDDGSFTATFDYYDRNGDLSDEQIHFQEPGELHKWMDGKGIEFPSDFLRNLNQHYLKNPELPPMPSPTTWHATVDDVLSLTLRQFDVYWHLSYESADDSDNVDSFETLTEAMAFLGETGALAAIPGNGASIMIGSITLYDSHFTSRGIDRGDSHVNPGMKERTCDLYNQILAIEKQNNVLSETPSIDEAEHAVVSRP